MVVRANDGRLDGEIGDSQMPQLLGGCMCGYVVDRVRSVERVASQRQRSRQETVRGNLLKALLDKVAWAARAQN